MYSMLLTTFLTSVFHLPIISRSSLEKDLANIVLELMINGGFVLLGTRAMPIMWK
jgi:hypothetical protein